MIYPRYITAEAIIAYVRARKNSMDSNIETLYHMYDSQVEAIEFRVDAPSAVTDVPLMDLSLKKNLLVACIFREGKILIPERAGLHPGGRFRNDRPPQHRIRGYPGYFTLAEERHE